MLSKRYLPVPFEKVKRNYIFCFAHTINLVLYSKQGIWVGSCNSIQFPEVCTKLICVTGLGTSTHGLATPLTTAWLYDVVLQHILNFFPKTLKFDWINLVRMLPTRPCRFHLNIMKNAGCATGNKCQNSTSSFSISLCSSDVRWDSFLYNFERLSNWWVWVGHPYVMIGFRNNRNSNKGEHYLIWLPLFIQLKHFKVA